MTQNEIYFDPQIPVPEGLVGAKVGYVDVDVQSPSEPPVDSWGAIYQNDEDEEVDDTEENLEGEDFLETPNEVIILSQSIRTAPDGSQVVDVVIDVEETAGAVDYQVRVTKA